MKTSAFKKVHRDILLEWIYDDNNYITESFSVLNNIRDNQLSYIGGNLTGNSIDDQLFPVDIVRNKYAKIDTTLYNFLQISNYNSDCPINHYTLKIHFPVNFNFREYQGIHLKVYIYDFTNKKLINLSSFFYDRNDDSKLGRIETVKSILYENRLWDKELVIEIPSALFLSLDRTLGVATEDSINDVLTNGVGISLTSPIFIDFSFITNIQTIGSQRFYTLSNAFTTQVSQSPDLQELQLYMQESSVGDYFEIYPIYNNSFDDFVSFMDQSVKIGKVYYTEYLITIFEQDIKGKTTKFTIDSDFTEIIEWRPIIKYSTTNAIIDVEMRLIDKVDNSTLTRKASYGLKPDQISKYSLNLKKIKIQETQKPKIYVKKNIVLAEVDSLTRGNQQEVTVNIDTPILISINSVYAFSENDINPKSDSTLLNYHPIGGIKILIEPFDNMVRFSLATKSQDSLDFLDLTNSQNLILSFKSDKNNYEFGLNPNASNLKVGSCSFKIPQNAYQDLKKSYVGGNNIFYITTNNNGVRTILYSGLFLPSDSKEAKTVFSEQSNINNDSSIGDIILQEEDFGNTALVTRKLVTISGTSSLS